MPRRCLSKRNAGFTLVELLVVIAIITVLAGTTLLVINPTQMQRKAREAVLKAKTGQLCLALNACGSVHDDATLCDESTSPANPFANVGATVPTEPLTALYDITNTGVATGTVRVSGSLTTGSTTCVYDCTFNFGTGAIQDLTGVGCL
jgi:prepilin-type N-terminal cleavage/methylation domain-containing protein